MRGCGIQVRRWATNMRGVAVKVADGGYRAVPPALIAALAAVDGVTALHVKALAEHARPPLRGGGRTVGHLEPVLSLARRD